MGETILVDSLWNYSLNKKPKSAVMFITGKRPVGRQLLIMKGFWDPRFSKPGPSEAVSDPGNLAFASVPDSRPLPS